MNSVARRSVSRWAHGLAACALLAGAAAAHAQGPAPGAWQRVQPTGTIIGLDGRPHAATCSGYPGTDPRYSFWVRKGTSGNLVVYFEGGGACWNNLTCTYPGDGSGQGLGFYTPAIAAGASPAQLDGIFNLQRDDNPVKDWDMVYLPYCTADLHTGSADRKYTNVETHRRFGIRHRGFDNTMVVLDWVQRHLATPQSVLVAGSSAGGYGATVNFPWLRVLYPGAQLSLLADASQGITTPDFDTGGPGAGRGSWNVQLPPWAAGIDPASIPGPQLMHAAAQAHPEVRASQFTTVLDEVQIGFYAVMRGCFTLDGACASVPLEWYTQMATGVLTDAATLPNYRHYVAAGSYHTILTDPAFYGERSGGRPVKVWLEGMLQGEFGAWRSLACPGCLP